MQRTVVSDILHNVHVCLLLLTLDMPCLGIAGRSRKNEKGLRNGQFQRLPTWAHTLGQSTEFTQEMYYHSHVHGD